MATLEHDQMPPEKKTKRRRGMRPQRNDPTAMLVGAYLERLRDLAGVSQERLARAVGYRSQSEVSALERGDRIDFDAYDAALRLFGMRPAVFFAKIDDAIGELTKIARRDGVNLEGARNRAVRGLARWLAEVDLPEDTLKAGRRLDA